MDTLSLIQRLSESLSNKNETHITFAIDKKTLSLKIVGDEASVDSFTENKELTDQIEQALHSAKRMQPQGGRLFSKTRMCIFAAPDSKDWRGAERIRTLSSQLLSNVGFGHKEEFRLGVGNPPLGWPSPLISASFTGPSRVSVAMNTEIIKGSCFGNCRLKQFLGSMANLNDIGKHSEIIVF